MLACVAIAYVVSLLVPGRANVEGLTVYTLGRGGASEGSG